MEQAMHDENTELRDDLAAMTADRDALRAELDRTKGEMERVSAALIESQQAPTAIEDSAWREVEHRDRVIAALRNKLAWTERNRVRRMSERVGTALSMLNRYHWDIRKSARMERLLTRCRATLERKADA